MKLHYGDLNDSSSLVKIIASVKPTEIYNLGAMSHVKVIIFFNKKEWAEDRRRDNTIKIFDFLKFDAKKIYEELYNYVKNVLICPDFK